MIEDTQSKSDSRQLPISRVGIKNIQYPITVFNYSGHVQRTIGNFEMYVNLPHDQKGTHMSRFIEILNDNKDGISLDTTSQITAGMKSELEAETAYLKVTFPYFVEKEAPVTRTKSFMNYAISILCESADSDKLTLTIDVPVTTLCPCSKSISEYGAHNQRGLVRVQTRFAHKMSLDFENIINRIEKTSSCEIFALLKREDEKFVTERAYENPVFVEDLVRDIALSLSEADEITWFSVEVTNFESIHNHDAYAFIEVDKQSATSIRQSEAVLAESVS
ncbi:GTP cyclohydrolase I FolE2 [bacterium]|nr:GTP cyclohydrolase I FolE2 [bacterium]